ncbi:hypothetical protein CkaCkLH20_12841 [Colletotrichum karsti]|uniref:Uncharacterized protein n=1 Tax=Colletotrichum karsti TaxID=1095194 RepID=A0A9P6LCU0_9PEZI|nr:uncharacterized protein CkaCkLH20_12841 [Colletotrichum karsti]KAF9869654.1 hypothetical protein CkaCkLH20_12841 [Colletotrichum karsti]
MPPIVDITADSAEAGDGLVFVSFSHPGDIAECATQIRSHVARKNHPRRKRKPQPTITCNPQDPEQSSTLVQRTGAVPQSYFQSILWPRGYDPIAAFMQQLPPNEDKLIRVFVKHSVLRSMNYAANPETMLISNQDAFWRSVTRYWVQTAFIDRTMLSYIFLITCRYLAERKPDWNHRLSQKALQYKQKCLRELDFASPTSDQMIVKRFALAADEMICGSPVRAQEHIRSAGDLLRVKTIKGRGGDFSFDESTGRLVINFSEGFDGKLLGTVKWKNPSSKPESDEEGETEFTYFMGNGNTPAANVFAG